MKYVVQKGDTLYGISRQFGVSVSDIQKANSLNSIHLPIGLELTIPSLGTISNYVVQRGDTLYSISKKYNISVEELMLLNNLSSNLLSVGQVLNVPVGDTVEDFNSYEVLPGDTLYSIAMKYDTTVDSLVQLNHLTSNFLSVGQILKVPSSFVDIPDSGMLYTVKPGDTLYSIAKKFGVSVSDLISLNSLKSNTLSVGQTLIVSSYSDGVELGSSCYGDAYEEPVFITHIVKKGDNLYSIAKKYGVGVDSIVMLNQLSNNNLSIGQELKIKEVY